jgi:hypothetical protein
MSYSDDDWVYDDEEQIDYLDEVNDEVNEDEEDDLGPEYAQEENPDDAGFIDVDED